MSELKLRDRVERLEAENKMLQEQLKELTGQISRTNDLVGKMCLKLDEMYPVVKEVTMAKVYGSFTWKALKWIGGVTFTIIVTWNIWKHSLKDFFTYIFK